MQFIIAPFGWCAIFISFFQLVEYWHSTCNIYVISEWEGHMQKLIKAFENMMVAITFAEAGEFDEAKRLSIQDQTEETTTETASLGIKATKA